MKTTKILAILVLALGLAAETANADFIFGAPTNLGPTVNTSSVERYLDVSADGLELYFTSGRPGGYGDGDIWVATRETIEDDWGTPFNLGPTVNSSYYDGEPSISADGLSLYFMSGRPGGSGGPDIWITTRATKGDPWGTPVNLGPTVNSSSYERAPSISADRLTLFLHSDRPGGYGDYDIWVTTRATIGDDWGTPINLGPTVNSSVRDWTPSISADGLSLFFSSDRPGGYGTCDLWVSRRATTSDPWGLPVNLGPKVNSSFHEHEPSLSADGRTLFFDSKRPGGVGDFDIWQVSILPVVDFNGDGIVDAADMCIMVDHWHTDEPSCDIGPTPFGDGIVDVQDLIVLAEHLFEEVDDPTLIAHWKLDEAEGDIAHDSAAANDGTVHGDPTWQPTGGQIDGALALDGTDDYVSTGFVLNPAESSFSVFAWVKAGTPGQVIISQTDGMGSGETWVSLEPSDGKLMTGLVPPSTGRVVPLTLVSESIITDGQWHRVCFVWDGSYRHLYLDGAEVAKDTTALSGLESANGGLYIGAGSNLDAASFFSGLIDDVRIYNRAITP